MDSNLLIPLLLFGGSKQRMGNILKRTLPVAMPGPPGQRFALAALVADKELKRQEQADQEIIQQVVKAGRIKDSATLAATIPALHAVFVNLPEAVQASIEFPADTARSVDGARKS
jgi:hypothetical protein